MEGDGHSAAPEGFFAPVPQGLLVQRFFSCHLDDGHPPMNSKVVILATLSAVALGIVVVGADGRAVCVPRTPDTAGQDVGFELIDLMRREAWVTTDWTVEAYSEFSPGITALNWLKNDPRQGSAAHMAFLRSPGCAAGGEFTFQTMFGRTFVHVADLTSLRGDDLTNGALTEASVRKHHRLEFEPGQTVSFLVSPSDAHFVRVNRPIDASQGETALPDGWVLQDLELTHAWQADLIGEVQVLRLDDGTSYQGPIVQMPVDAVLAQTEPSHVAQN